MNVPDIIGVEVITPDGRGSILTLHHKKVVVALHKKGYMQVMKGSKRGCELHYAYDYEEVHIIKGQYCFDDKRIDFQYGDIYDKPEPIEPVEQKSLHLFGKKPPIIGITITPEQLNALKGIKRPNKL